MHSLIIKTQCLSNTLSFVVTAADSNRINAAAVALGLRMDFWISINFRSAGQQQAGTNTPSQAQHVVRAQEARFRRFDRIELIMNR